MSRAAACTGHAVRPGGVRLRRLGAVGLLALASLGVQPAAAGACGPVETVPDEGHHHLVEGNEPPVPYTSTPPTSGWHHRGLGVDHIGVHAPDEPLDEVDQVSVLAADGVVITYRDLPPAEVDALEAYVEGEERPVALTPYNRLAPGQVAMTAWNTKQVCEGLDVDAVAAFVAAHAGEELDPTMGGHAPDDHAQHGDVVADPPAEGDEPRAAVLLVAVIALGGLAAAGVVLGLRPRAGGPPGR